MSFSPRTIAKRGPKYFVVIVVGLALDIALAWTLEAVAGFPLVVCSAAGFLTAVAANYILFEYWVFDAHRFSLRRFALSYASSLGALAVRLAAISVFALVPWDSSVAVLGKLVAAAGVSFVVNYILVNAIFNHSH